MLIDWFTVIAQAVNFLILVWLLKRFLYKPILDALDAREKRIAAELADAEKKQAEARQERDEFHRKHEEFERQRAALLKKAEDEAKAERQRLFDEVRKESNVLQARWQEALRAEHQGLNEELIRRTREEVFAITRKTLADLATAGLEEQIIDAFIHRLRGLNQSDREGLKSALHPGPTPAIVRTTFELSGESRRAIENVITNILAFETPIHFETSPDLVSGIELTANGYKVAWSIGHYLASLNHQIHEMLPRQLMATQTAGTRPEQKADKYHA